MKLGNGLCKRLSAVFSLVLVGLVLTGCSPGAKASQVEGEPGKFPAVLGTELGQSPQIAKGEGKAPTALQSKLLTVGTGEKVRKTDQILVRYASQLWDGTKVSSNFGLDQVPQAFKLHQLMPGWQKGLVGKPTGSRVLLVVPPQDGFQDQRSKVPKDATQVFVIDLISRVDLTDTSALKASNSSKVRANFSKIPPFLKVAGEVGEKPTIQVTDQAGKVDRQQVLMLYQGKGEKLEASDLPAVHLTWVEYRDGKWTAPFSTWDQGEMTSTPTPVNNTQWFLGVPIGSRILVLQPAQEKSTENEAHPDRAVIYDIAGKQNTR